MSKRKEEIEPVEISQEENGYYVITGSDFDRESQEKYVFQTFAELEKFLGEHFTHRNDDVIIDEYNSNDL